jgi:hypothetical protein
VQFIGQHPLSSLVPSNAKKRLPWSSRHVFVRMIDIWLETASTTGPGSVPLSRARRNARVSLSSRSRCVAA